MLCSDVSREQAEKLLKAARGQRQAGQPEAARRGRA